MKLTKLMLSATIAALALVSCNKSDTTPEVANRLKTVEVSLENVIFTKGLAGDKINANDPVKVTDFQIFLTDGDNNTYTGKVSDGSGAAQSYWNAENLKNGIPVAEFHYVDPNCTKVVAVANMGEIFADYADFLAKLENLSVDTQQDQGSLALYAETTDLKPAGTHTDVNVEDNVSYISNVYTASLELCPRVSRFEVDGFSVKYNDPANPKYKEVNITQLAFQNYYPETSLVTGAEAGTLVNHVTDFANQAAVYTWLDTPETPQPWFRDYVDLDITPAAPVQDLPADGKLAYHIFSTSAAVPQFIIKLTADGQPAFLYTKNFRDAAGEPVNEFKEGYIYRMSAAGDDLADGTIEIPEDKIDPMDRCLEITVTVKKWQVEIITPEF